MLSRHPPLGPLPRRRPQQTRSITADGEGPNRPQLGRLIPKPEVPCYPVHDDFRLLTPGRGASTGDQDKGLFDIGPAFFTTAGKTALAWAFRASGLQPGAAVLLPAYHCLAMVEPLPWLGLKPVFYRLHEDLSIDYAALEARLDERCKALVAVHYFGFPQDGPRLREFCAHHGLSLIEDCAHSFFGHRGEEPLGSFGDFAIGSLPKFFPVASGGCLVSAHRQLPREPLAAPGALADLRSLVRDLQTTHYYGRLRPLGPVTTGTAALLKALSLLGLGRDMARLQDSPASLDYDAGRMGGTIRRACDAREIAARRRDNYRTICAALSGQPAITPVKPELEAGVVPYMVPLRIPALRRIFAQLEDRAVPMQRFGQFLSTELDDALCPVSSDLSHHGLQLPCHQNLLPEEIQWMIDRLCEICAAAQG